MCTGAINIAILRVEDVQRIGPWGSMLDPATMAPPEQIPARSGLSSEPLSVQSTTMVEKPVSSGRPLTKLH
jgi:hypothetical protein